MRKEYVKKRRQQSRPLYGVVVNPNASDYSKKAIDELIEKIVAKKANWHTVQTSVTRDAIYQIKKLLQRRPAGIIACGGDGTVNLVARNMIRRTTALGIFPLGKMNNIFRSLYGEPSGRKAIQHIFSGDHLKIDYGLAGKRFFLGSFGIGLMREMHETLQERRLPRFGIGWSRLTSQVSARVSPKKFHMTIDQFTYDITPIFFNINLLPYSVGLPLSPMSLPGDGCAEVLFDPKGGKSILSGFIRKIHKKNYIFSDDILMYRGKKITISPVAEESIYLDGETWEPGEPDIEIEIFQEKIRVFKEADKKE